MGTRIPAPAGARLAVVKRMAPKIENRGPQLLAIDTAFLCAAVIANVLRCYVRIRMVRGFGADDWLMAIATVSDPKTTARGTGILTSCRYHSSHTVLALLLELLTELDAIMPTFPSKILKKRRTVGGTATSFTAPP